MTPLDGLEAACAVIGRHAGDVDAGARWPAEGMAALAEAGLLGLTVPREFGGGEAGPTTFTAAASAIASKGEPGYFGVSRSIAALDGQRAFLAGVLLRMQGSMSRESGDKSPHSIAGVRRPETLR